MIRAEEIPGPVSWRYPSSSMDLLSALLTLRLAVVSVWV